MLALPRGALSDLLAELRRNGWPAYPSPEWHRALRAAEYRDSARQHKASLKPNRNLSIPTLLRHL
jgi:hypothetical protein